MKARRLIIHLVRSPMSLTIINKIIKVSNWRKKHYLLLFFLKKGLKKHYLRVMNMQISITKLQRSKIKLISSLSKTRSLIVFFLIKYQIFTETADRSESFSRCHQHHVHASTFAVSIAYTQVLFLYDIKYLNLPSNTCILKLRIYLYFKNLTFVLI